MISFTEHSKHIKKAPINNGLHYWESGEGPVLLFLHGALSNSYTWRKILPELSRSFRCIALHLPLGGHQIALSPQLDLTPTGIAGLIHDFIRYKQIDSFSIIANDTGGAYAQVYASIYPEGIHSMILSNCEVKDVFPPPSFIYLRYAVHIPFFLLSMSKLFSWKKMLKHPFVLGKLSDLLSAQELAEGYVRDFVKNKDIRNDFKRAVIHWRPVHTRKAAEKLKQFKKPVLVIWGAADKSLFPRKLMQQLLEIFPNAEWTEIPHAKTYIQEDAPAETIEHIKEFMKRIHSV